MERMRERQVADLNNPLKDIIGIIRMRNVLGTITMRNGMIYDIDDYRIENNMVRFIQSYGYHPTITVRFRDVREVLEMPHRQNGREVKFPNSD